MKGGRRREGQARSPTERNSLFFIFSNDLVCFIPTWKQFLSLWMFGDVWRLRPVRKGKREKKELGEDEKTWKMNRINVNRAGESSPFARWCFSKEKHPSGLGTVMKYRIWRRWSALGDEWGGCFSALLYLFHVKPDHAGSRGIFCVTPLVLILIVCVQLLKELLQKPLQEGFYLGLTPL